MRVTEEDAKTKLCCGPKNCGIKANNGFRYCETEECMAWVWSNKRDGDKNLLPQEDWTGYCGLTSEKPWGKPWRRSPNS